MFYVSYVIVLRQLKRDRAPSGEGALLVFLFLARELAPALLLGAFQFIVMGFDFLCFRFGLGFIDNHIPCAG